MGILDDLDGILADHPACIVAAYADLSTGMVLGVRARANPPQEDLDALSRQAVEMLADGPAAPGPMAQAIRLTGEDTRIFLRADSPEAEAWCCIFPASVDGAAALARLERALGAGAVPT